MVVVLVMVVAKERPRNNLERAGEERTIECD